MWFGGPVAVGLGQTVSRRMWPLVRPESMREAITVVLCHRPRLVVMQVADEQELGMAVIGMLHRRGSVSLLAVAGEHSLTLESRVRALGANGYLPEDASEGEVVRMVRALLARSGGEEHPRDAPWKKGGVNRWMACN